MQVHPIYEENRRLRAENERLWRLIRAQRQANMRRYAAACRARREREDRKRWGPLRVRFGWNTVCRSVASAAAFARDLFEAMPLSARCLLSVFAGGYMICVLLTIAMKVWLAWLS